MIKNADKTTIMPNDQTTTHHDQMPALYDLLSYVNYPEYSNI